MNDFKRLSVTASALRTILQQADGVARLAEEQPSLAAAASAAQAARAAAIAIEALRLIGDIPDADAALQQAALINRARRALQLVSEAPRETSRLRAIN